MRIESLKTLHADGGRRAFDFVKLTTDDGLVGWSEYNETFGGAGLTALIERLAPTLIGKDPRAHEAHVALMQAIRRTAAGGVVQQAIGAIENALLDVKARALGIPIYELLGGPVRDRIRVYWSHCGTYRVGWWQELGLPPVRTLDDVVRLGREVVSRGYTALKTNVMLLGDQARLHNPGFARGEGFPELNPDRHVLAAARDQLAAFREGAGLDVDILVDLNFNFKTEGFLKVARAIAPFTSCGWRSTVARRAASGTSASAARSRWPRASVSSVAATTARSSSATPWTWRSSTSPGTGSGSP